MAKVTLTLEDNGNRVTVSMQGAGSGFANTRAESMGRALFELAEIDAKYSQLPAHQRQPAPNSLQ